MKNGKRDGIGVSDEVHEGRAKARPYTGGRQSTAHSRQLRGEGEGRGEKRDGRGAKKEIDAVALWRQVEDVVAPRLGLKVVDHLVYVNLLRHSRLEGRRRVHFSITWLAGNIHLSMCATREAVRRLAGCGVLRLVERSKQGHVAEVRLPEEVPGVRAAVAALAREAARLAKPPDIEKLDFLKTVELRKTIHARERGRCFYCRRRIPPRLACLDHVVPRARAGCHSYRNLVSSCLECNSEKGERPAGEFLRWLFREHRLGAAELKGRFEALEMLAAGKLRPVVASGEGEGTKRDPSLRSG